MDIYEWDYLKTKIEEKEGHLKYIHYITLQ